MKITIATNERGQGIGENHHSAKLTNADVELIRQLHAQGMSYPTLAAKFEVNKYHIGRICRFQRRAQYAVAFKEVRIGDV